MQIFPRSLNKLPLIAGAGAALALPAVVFLIWYYFSPWFTQVGYRPPHCIDEKDCPPGTQPVAYQHSLHAGTLGIDCRYCHANVEHSAVAMVPPIETCMNCHSLVKTDSARLQPIRDQWCAPLHWVNGKCDKDPQNPEPPPPFEWTRVHKLPDYAYFDHSVHVTAGVGCRECHERIDQMDVVEQTKPLSMGWCLECHRDVKENQTASIHIRPKDVEVTNMDWVKGPNDHPTFRRDHLSPPENCSGCHR
jgi:hypothetical protein